MGQLKQPQDLTIRTKRLNESANLLGENPELDSASESQTSKNSTTDIDSFPLFSQLPTEVRLDIWDEAARSEGRIVEMCLSNREYFPKTPTPVLFHVSYEAREAGKRIYKIQESRKGFEIVQQMPVNYDIDIPLVDYRIISNGSTNHLTELDLETHGSMRRIAIRLSHWRYFNRDFDSGSFYFHWNPNMWKSLTEIIILAPTKSVRAEREYSGHQTSYATAWIKPVAMGKWWDEENEKLARCRSGSGAMNKDDLRENSWSSVHAQVQASWERYFEKIGRPRSIRVSRGVIFNEATGRRNTPEVKVGFPRTKDAPNRKRDEDWVNFAWTY